jgi:CRP-like cAMP-binding protein
LLLKEYDLIDSILIVKSGELEIIKEIDGIDLVMARLKPGSAINSCNMMFPG